MANQEGITPVGTIRAEEVALDNKFFPVVQRIIETPDGATREQLIWDRRGKEFSVLLARTEDAKFILVKEPKYGQMKDMLTVPAGRIKDGESPEDAAKRELLEETGYEVEEVVLLKQRVVDFADKIAGGAHYLFLGLDAQQTSSPPEQFREVVELTREEAEKLLDGELADLELDIAISLTTVALVLRWVEKEDMK